jgi:hypothetical protein
VSDWQVLFTLRGQSLVRGFSDDDSRVLAIWPHTAIDQPILTEIIDRRSGLVVWHSQSNEEPMRFETRSGTGDFALAMREPAAPACPPIPSSCFLLFDVGVLLVQSDGSTIQIPGRQYPVW